MAAIRFYLNPLKNGTAQVIAALQSGSGTPPTKYTGYTVPSNKIKGEYKFWDKKKQQVRGTDNAGEINKKLSTWKATFESYIADCNLAGDVPNMQFIKDKLQGTYLSTYKKNNTQGATLLQVVDRYLADVKPTIKDLTYRGYKVIKHQLEAYEKKTGRTILISEINETFYKQFTEYLLRTENNINKTVNRKIRKTATIVRYGIETLKLKTDHLDFARRTTLKDTKAAKFPLRPEEIATLKAKALDKEKPLSSYHLTVLHAFLLACEAGLRFSDAQQLRPSHVTSIASDHGLVRFIDFTQIKGSKDNKVPLSDYACSIIDAYTRETNDKLFDFSYSQSISRILKEVFEAAELTRPCEIVRIKGATPIREIKPLHDVISFHHGRNTYITRLLMAGLAPVHVQGNAGHSDLKTTMGYFRPEDTTRLLETLKILNSN
jgi:integrase